MNTLTNSNADFLVFDKLFRIDNTSGFKGVDQTESGSWRARKRRKQLGTFATKQEAINAYRSAL